MEVAWREAEISLEDQESVEKKEIYKRKKAILEAEENFSENQSKRTKHKNKGKSKHKN